ncbi:MAG: hypothetical protein K2Y39_15410, partial [Candidatus Obscuribacterales bacterium]|nr:hypothetical protein [Candidatus Obscuribacterales bacterium]
MVHTIYDVLSAKQDCEAELLRLKGVHGVGIGPKKVAGVYTGQVSIIVFVDKKLPESNLDASSVVPREINGYATDVVAKPRVGSHKTRSASRDLQASNNYVYSPLVGGCRISSSEDLEHTGTLGMIVIDESGRPAILSCKHVTETSGTIFQPGIRHNLVAQVTKVGSRDCALAALDSGVLWTNFVLGIGPIQAFFNINPNDLKKSYPVRKTGAVTGTTSV